MWYSPPELRMPWGMPFVRDHRQPVRSMRRGTLVKTSNKSRSCLWSIDRRHQGLALWFCVVCGLFGLEVDVVPRRRALGTSWAGPRGAAVA
jgi:hypothetical protein